MDVAAIATGMALTGVSNSVSVGVMSQVQNLEQNLVSRLFGSMGIGNGVDTYA